MAIQIHFVNPNSTQEMGKTITELVTILATKKLRGSGES